MHVNSEVKVEKREAKWIFSKAKWNQSEYLCDLESSEIALNKDKEKVDERFKEVVLKAAHLSMPRSKGKMNRKAVPCWTEECSKAIKRAICNCKKMLVNNDTCGR